MEERSTVEQAPGHPGIVRILAPNPGPMTLEGTNTYLVGSNPCWVIDPGPDDSDHVALVLEQAGLRGGIGGVLLTHTHGDHVGALEALGIEPTPLAAGVRVGELAVVAPPGHADDHFVFMTADRVCFSGDLVLGSGSSFVPQDGGSLAAYMDSLARVRQLDPTLICPGHGPWVTDPVAKLDEYVEHREARERGLLEAIARGERSRSVLLAEVWADVPAELRPAAALVMEAHVEKLVAEGRIEGNLDE